MVKIVLTLALVAGVLFGITVADGSEDVAVETSPIEQDSCEEEKPGCISPNEIYDDCDTPCPARRCDFRKDLVRCKAPPKKGDKECLVGCRCKDGFLRNDKKVCVPENQCPKKCPANEEFDLCPDCNPRLCETKDRLYKCKEVPTDTSDPQCKAQCRCKKGFFRNYKGQCVKASECEKCDGPNEFFSCGSACDNVCGSKIGWKNCNIRNIKCNPKCYCKEGFSRNANNTCVPVKECPKPVCKENEMFTQCTNSISFLLSKCEDLTKNIKFNRSAPSQPCKEGCVCKGGYLRAKNGTCVPTLQCDAPLPTCDEPNQELTPCGRDGCKQRFCSDLDGPIVCRDRAGCTPTCECKEGFLRTSFDDNTCVPINKCPRKCKGPNEFFQCGPECDNVCGSKIGWKNCNIQNIQCNPKCYCKDGFARDANNTCVPVKDCPQKCPANEKYEKCPSILCKPQTCDEAGNNLSNCNAQVEGEGCPGKPGCICEDGFLRDSNGVCINSTLCASCGNDKNATYGCGVNCGQTCSTYENPEDDYCFAICHFNACDCRPGFVFDDQTRKCVRSSDCSPPCPLNEQYSLCKNSIFSKKKCEELNELNKEVDYNSPGEPCEEGCVCNAGFLRAKNGTCVPTLQCDVPLPKCKPNQELSPCGRDGCLKMYCSDLDLPPLCRDTFACIPTCECNEGFLRASFDNDTCVPIDECPTPTCGVNEVYSKCVNGVCGPQDCSEKGQTILCKPIFPGSCFGGCICAGKFLRKNGTCVPEDECESNSGSNTTDETSTPPGEISPGETSPGETTPGETTPGETTPGETTPGGTSTAQGSESTCDTKLQQEAITEGNIDLTGKVFYQVVKNNPGVSSFVSAFSLLPPLSQLLLYSVGDTQQELKNAVGVKDESTIRCGLPGILDSIKGTNGTVLDLGAKIYVYEGGKLSQSFQEDSEKIFKAKAENLDFNKPQNASDVINQWVSDVTRGKITDLVNPDMFDSSTRLVLANGIYFKGTWKSQFNPNNTKPRDFHVSSDKVIQVPTMQQKGNFLYAELSDPDVQVLELKYNDGETSCVIVLPKQIDGLLSVVEKLQDPKVFKSILSNLRNEKVTVYLPRIPEITTETNLVDVLRAIGVKSVFDSAKSQLSGMVEPDEPLYVSSAVQKATVTIDEEGSEAAAANAFVVSTRSLPRPPPIEYTFDANHPFTFLIKRNDLVLFMGSFYK